MYVIVCGMGFRVAMLKAIASLCAVSASYTCDENISLALTGEHILMSEPTYTQPQLWLRRPVAMQKPTLSLTTDNTVSWRGLWWH